MINLALIQACSGKICLPSKTYVQIYNSLPAELTIHCKSGDDDLGVQHIPQGGSWQFDFKPNLFCKTLFFCSMQWLDQFHYFDIYDAKRDYDQCLNKCEWFVKPTGPCLYGGDCGQWKS
ncbi:hypothetical protein BT93_J0098 [Corymbia citriodora subsp. variegata]|nr:hypothetical protein BT93_J0098 [Corymbia citriodora subsp. variegata]